MNSSSPPVPRRRQGHSRALVLFLSAVALADVLLVWAARREPAAAALGNPTQPEAVNETVGANTGSGRAQTPQADPAPEAASLAEAPGENSALTRPRLSAGVEDIEKLAKAKVDDQVLEAFIEHSPVAYYLSPEEIVYLRGLGVSAETVARLIRHGAKLRGQAAQEWKEKEQQARAAAPARAPGPMAPATTPPAAPAYAPVHSAGTPVGPPTYAAAAAAPGASSVIYFPGYSYRHCRPYFSCRYRGYWRPYVSLYASYWHPRWSFGFAWGPPRFPGGWRTGWWCW